MASKNSETPICWFDALGSEDVSRGGGKNASLGEMIGQLKEEGVRVPDGFAAGAELRLLDRPEQEPGRPARRAAAGGRPPAST